MSSMHFITDMSSGSFISLTGLIPFGHITEMFDDHWEGTARNGIPKTRFTVATWREVTLESMC